MEPIHADFSVDPARLGNVVVRREGCFASSSHLILGTGGWIELHFAADGPRDTEQAVVKVTALVSKSGARLGHAPIDVLINDVPVIEGYIIPGGDLPTDTALAIPGERLVAGTNVLRIQTSEESLTGLWLYRITVDAVENRGGAALAMRREAAEGGSVFAYRAERRPAGMGTWRPLPRVVVHIDRGEYADLRRLSWRDEDGTEAAVSFHSAMRAFHGHHRAKDGTVSELRGERVGSWTAPEEVSPRAVHVFKAQESWGDGWHDSHDLRLLLDDGGADVERVSWQDEAGNTGSVELMLPPPKVNSANVVTGRVTQVKASGENPGAGEVAANLLDDSLYSKWLTFSGTAWLEFTLEAPEAVGFYELTSANDFEFRDPRDWTLSGSPDGRMWTVLDTRSGEAFASRQLSRTFRVRSAAQAPYRHYRLEISRSAGYAQQLQLARVRLLRPAVAPALRFLGYYQRAGEGPIGYKGKALALTIPSAGSGTATASARPAVVGPPTIPGRPMTLGRIAGPPRVAAAGTRAVSAKRVPAKPGIPAKRSFPARVANPSGATAPRAPVSASREVVTAVDPALTTVEGWRAYLADYGKDVVRTMDERRRRLLTEDQLSSGWLGGDPVDESRIATLEARLGARLPASYRAFVGASDGWQEIGQFMYEMRGIADIDWFRVADPQTCEILGDDPELGPILRRALLISKHGDAQYWFLDPEDVSPEGEWAGYTWSSWGFLSERYPSFAALVAAERWSMEQLRGYRGVPMHPEGAEELLAEGRAEALRGEVEAALATFDRAAIKGSGAAAYLKVILGLFLKSRLGQHDLRNGVFGRPHVMAAVGLEQLRAEAVPLFLHLTDRHPVTGVPAYLQLLENLLPLLPGELAELPQAADVADLDEQAADRLFDPSRPRKQLSVAERDELHTKLVARAEAFAPPLLPEPPEFQSALAEARALVQAADPDRAWAVIEAALPGWHSESTTRVAPVVLLFDPVLSTLITPRRAQQIARTPRGAA